MGYCWKSIELHSRTATTSKRTKWDGKAENANFVHEMCAWYASYCRCVGRGWSLIHSPNFFSPRWTRFRLFIGLSCQNSLESFFSTRCRRRVMPFVLFCSPSFRHVNEKYSPMERKTFGVVLLFTSRINFFSIAQHNLDETLCYLFFLFVNVETKKTTTREFCFFLNIIWNSNFLPKKYTEKVKTKKK